MSTYDLIRLSPYPDVADVERLILTLYRTTDPEERSSVDRTLIELQRSLHGFQIADQLLQSSHDEARFYGARTFIVKINKDLNSLEEKTRQELLERLVFWFVTATHNDYSLATFRKICSAIVAYFIQSEGRWTSYLSTLRLALLDGETKPDHGYAASMSSETLRQPSAKDERALLVFVSTLLQEVTGLEFDGPKSLELDAAISSSLSAIVDIINRPLAAFISDSGSLATAEEAIDTCRCLVLWAKTAPHDEETLLMTRNLAGSVISLLLHDELTRVVSQFIYEVLTEYPLYFSEPLFNQLAEVLVSPKASAWLQRLTSGHFEDESLWMGKLLIAYGEVRVESLSASSSSEPPLFFKQLLIPLACTGVPAAEDPIVSPALEFWSNFTETVREQNEEHMYDPQRWLSWKSGVLKDLLLCIRARVKHPEIEQWRGLTPDEKKLFSYFRSDARDLLGSLEAFFGLSVTLDMASTIEDHTGLRDWLSVEASFFCLNSILSQVDYDEKVLRQISRPLFRSTAGTLSVIEQIRAATTEIPAVVFKEVIAFFSATESLAQQDSSLLLLILQCLAEWFSLRPLAMSAAGVFAHVCTQSRDAVMQTGSGDQLLSLLQTYSRTTTRDFVVQEKLAGAVAAVAQAYAAISSPEAGLMLDALLTVTQDDVQMSLRLHETDLEKARAFGLCALRCLENIGKAFRIPETAIDLDEEEEPQKPSFWLQHPNETQAAQVKILDQCTAVLGQFNGPEEVHAVCHILKSGYTESETGPFVFPLDATATLLKVCHLSTPSIGEVFKNVSVLLEKHRSRKSADWVLQFAQDCLQHVQSMIQPYFQGDPSVDPEVAALVVDFFKSYVPTFIDVLVLASQQSSDSLDFTITCLASNEILPKQSAALFWARFVKGPPGAMMDDYHGLISRYQQSLAQILIQQIGGGASRSDLEYFAEPIKAIVFKGGVFRNYMRDALAGLDIQDDRVSEKDKRIFLEKIFSLRGGARSGKVIQEFWAQCRGTFVLS